MAKHRLIEPHLATPNPKDQTGSSRLPEALLSEQVQRVAIAAAVGGGLWTYGLLMDTVIRPATVISGIVRSNVFIELASILLSVLMYLYVRYANHPPQTKSDAGLLYIVLNAVAVALLNSWVHPPLDQASTQLSWNTVVILVSAMIIPTTPRKILITSVIAASMDPLIVWFGHLRGLPVPSMRRSSPFLS